MLKVEENIAKLGVKRYEKIKTSAPLTCQEVTSTSFAFVLLKGSLSFASEGINRSDAATRKGNMSKFFQGIFNLDDVQLHGCTRRFVLTNFSP